MIVSDGFFCVCEGKVKFSKGLIASKGGDACSICGAMVHLEGSSHELFSLVEFLGAEVLTDLWKVFESSMDVVFDLGARPEGLVVENDLFLSGVSVNHGAETAITNDK